MKDSEKGTAMNGIDKVVKEVGGQSELGRRLGVSRQRVANWVKTGKVPVHPENFVPKVADLVDGRVSWHELNADVYPE